MKRNILLTGCAGFIGSHLLSRLLADGHTVTGIDNFDPFYSRELKESNIAEHLDNPRFTMLEADLADPVTCEYALAMESDRKFDVIIHLAGKAGVGPSLLDPLGYQRSNLISTQNLLEYARRHEIKQFVYASSSTVYGVNPNIPWDEDEKLMPTSPYSASKASAELLGRAYSHLFGIRFIALRFFGVYGPRQRPDLVVHKFTRLVLNRETVTVFGDLPNRRAYTYVDDTVEGILAAMRYDKTLFEAFNIGSDEIIELRELLATIEEVVGIRAEVKRMPAPPADLPELWANFSKARRVLGFEALTPFIYGVTRFVESLEPTATRRVVEYPSSSVIKQAGTAV